jgi:hypothetical protein
MARYLLLCHLARFESAGFIFMHLIIESSSLSFVGGDGRKLRMEDFRWSFHYQDNINTQEDIQIRTPVESINFVQPGTCIDDDGRVAIIFDAAFDVFTKRPHDHGPASSGPMVQPDQTTEDATRLKLSCNALPNSLLKFRHSLFSTDTEPWMESRLIRKQTDLFFREKKMDLNSVRFSGVV